MFQFSGSTFIKLCIHLMITGFAPVGFPHSEICGSLDICSSPQLIAACHVLLRLLMPRHSPYALSSLTFLRPFELCSISFDDCLITRLNFNLLFSFKLVICLSLIYMFNFQGAFPLTCIKLKKLRNFTVSEN